MTNIDLSKTGEVLPPIDLIALAKQINEAHTSIVTSAKSAVSKAITAGEVLRSAQSAVPDGQWLRWLKANCIISDRTAQVYMQFADNKLVLECWLRDGGTQQIADQTMNGALRMLRGHSAKPPVTKDKAQRLEDSLLQTLVNLPLNIAEQRAARLVERLQEQKLID